MGRFFGRRITAATVLMAGMMVATMAAVAQAQQPTVVITIRGIEELLDDVDFLGEEVNHAGIKDLVEGQINAVTQGKGFAGIDQKKPLGAYWNVGGGLESTVIFLPVSDANDLKDFVKIMTTDFKETKGQWSFSINGSDVVAKMSGGYVFVSASADALAKLPDASKIINTNYDLAVDLNVADIPAPLKEVFLTETEANGRRSLEDAPEPQNNAEELGREYGFEGFLSVLKAVTNEGDRLTWGIEINSEKRLASTDVAVTSKPNSNLSKAMAAFGKTTPMFSALGAETAPFRIVVSYPTTGVIEQLNKVLEAIRESATDEIKTNEKQKSDQERQEATGYLNKLIDLTKATVKTGSMHLAMSLEPADENNMRMVFGTKVAKGEDANKLLDEILGSAKKNPAVGEIKLDVAKIPGARIHSVKGVKNEDVEKNFGDGPIHLAVKNDSFWMAAGTDNLKALTKALDQLGKPSTARSVAPISFQIKPAALILMVEDNDEDLIERAKEIAGKPGDRMNLEIVPATNGAKLRFEFGIDLLKLAPQDE